MASQQHEMSKDSVLGMGSWEENSQQMQMHLHDESIDHVRNNNATQRVPYRLQGKAFTKNVYRSVPQSTISNMDHSNHISGSYHKIPNSMFKVQHHHEHMSLEAKKPYSNRGKSNEV